MGGWRHEFHWGLVAFKPPNGKDRLILKEQRDSDIYFSLSLSCNVITDKLGLGYIEWERDEESDDGDESIERLEEYIWNCFILS